MGLDLKNERHLLLENTVPPEVPQFLRLVEHPKLLLALKTLCGSLCGNRMHTLCTMLRHADIPGLLGGLEVPHLHCPNGLP